MATRSTIAIVRQDGSVSQIYAHWDGYLSNNGILLFAHYQDSAKVEKLISLGSISSLDKEVDIPPGVAHSYDKSVDGITVFYGRDRGEKDVAPSHFDNLDAYKKHADFQGYDYIFKESNRTWYLFNSDTKRLNKLSTALSKDPESVNKLDEIRVAKEKAMLDSKLALSDKLTNPVPRKI